jgi:hypothetical protein
MHPSRRSTLQNSFSGQVNPNVNVINLRHKMQYIFITKARKYENTKKSLNSCFPSFVLS